MDDLLNQMMTKKILIVLLALPLCVSAQLLDKKILTHLDMALSRIRMMRADLHMRWDSYPDDAYRLPLIKQLFESPLSTLTVSDSLAHGLPVDFSSPRDFVESFAGPMDVRLPNFSLLPHRLTNQELTAKYGCDPSRFCPPLRAALVELLSGIHAADTLMRKARAVYTPAELRFLVANADSLLRENEEDAHASIVELQQEMDSSNETAKRIFGMASRFPRECVYEASAILIESVNIAKGHLAEMTDAERDTFRTITFNSAAGKIAVGGMGNDNYEGNYLCILDLGGDDVYRMPHSDKESAFALPASVILDLGGNDIYEGNEFCFGSGFFGVSILDDVAGDDYYETQNYALGSGFFGAGILLDESGSDKYSGGTFVEGCGAFGFGALIDIKGNDLYQAELNSQGFGFTSGFGAIVDVRGNDTYNTVGAYTDVLRYSDHFETFTQGCGLGYRPFASGGIGILYDRSGNDSYNTDIFGQGSAYWFALGALVDDSGNDRYNAYQYAQGAGIHLAFGALIDKQGTDYYTSHGVSLGCGHDLGFGGFLDLHGDDFYASESLSFGAGNADGISFFCDAAGNDAYCVKNFSNSFGYSDWRRDYGGIGVFLDLGGNDVYPSYAVRNNTVWAQSTYGVGVDEDVPDSAAIARKAEQHADDSLRAQRDLARDIPTLFTQASTAPWKYQYIVKLAEDKLVAMKDTSLTYLLGKLSTVQPRQALALELMLPRMKDVALAPLMDSLRSPQERTVAMCLYVLGKIGDSSSALAVLPLLGGANWRIRSSAAEQLGKMKNDTADSALVRILLRDTVEIARMRAAFSLGELRDADAEADLIAALRDTSYLVRYKAAAALDSIASGDKEIKKALLDSLATAESFQKEFLVESLAAFPKDRASRKILAACLRDSDVAVRGAALTAIERSSQKSLLRDVKKALKTESDASLRDRESALITKFEVKKKKKK